MSENTMLFATNVFMICAAAAAAPAQSFFVMEEESENKASFDPGFLVLPASAPGHSCTYVGIIRKTKQDDRNLR